MREKMQMEPKNEKIIQLREGEKYSYLAYFRACQMNRFPI